MLKLPIFPGIETFGKNAVVCGRSKNVGMPLAMLLHGDGVRPDGRYCTVLYQYCSTSLVSLCELLMEMFFF